ncbi:manganese efflux pump MntP family protein [Methanobrevibacter boviskoreani]|uniref:manganese efflux pump MntP n=2 Tax=Methanobrevibacter boviskoreani TaxID=1348249 RepID=UPI0023A7B385|nr:manganese efflux pump MntP family protein [Methanobrevibacter boviskoreani]MCI6930951.1 manganese efflux pump MntP family protein [Methanobrevibacter boviskoreani]MDD6257252.1 manganese efflux pump MntP family protein [Methanobrevibacter boviskoreani]MDY5613864.1 manganese efflux pump MntP family protein [Methanobrevibacter boviskoreani]
MDIVSTLLIAVALAMDAFSVSLTKGFTLKNITLKQILWFGVFFGGFQSLMPILGWTLGVQLQLIVSAVAPWIAFILLVLIGANMIRESFSDDLDDDEDTFSFAELTLLAVATSIDAFAVGVTYAVLKIDILIPVIIIGLVAFIFTVIGIYLGKKIGDYFGDKFEILGGVILILLGCRILLEGLGFL